MHKLGSIIRYQHHGTDVAVRTTLKGKHREHCLCYSCAHFHPEKPKNNCRKASLLYALCVYANITTPVWECSDFQEEKNDKKK